MAKVGLTKLGLKKNDEIKTFDWNEQIIEVKQYLPVEKKLELIGKVIELAHDENNFSNPLKVKVYFMLCVIEFYTNINFTEKQKEDVPKLYDLINGSELSNAIIANIPKQEFCELKRGLDDTIEAFYKYRNSILGILENISQDYSNLNLDLDEITAKIADPNSLEFVKKMVDTLG